jgi:ATP-dependent DNA helicase RecG
MSAQSFLKELIKQKEHTVIEFQKGWNTDKILRTICAFLNTEGGWIIIGHDGEELVGLPNITENEIDDLKLKSLNSIFPQPLIYIHLESMEDKKIVLLNVLKGSRKPYSYQKIYFIRTGALTREASPDDLSLILRSSNQYTSSWEKLTTVDASFSDLDEHEITTTIEFANRLGKAQSLPGNAKEFLSYFQLIDYSAVKNGALILYGKEPTRYFAQCRIRITNMPEGVTGDRFHDVEIIEGNLFESFDRVMDYLKKNNPIISQFHNDNPLRIDREMYPPDALDEAIINAMVHRDYGDMSGEITINIYKDKIEIINSGEIPSDIIKRKTIIEAHHSVLRNPTVAHMFFLRGKMEKLGRGLSLIKKRFEEYGHKSPEWTFQSGYTKLTMFGSSEEIKLNERMYEFLNQIGNSVLFGREEYVDFFNGKVKERTARMDLQKMTDGRWLTKVGNGPQTKYSKTNKKLPDIAGY